MPGKFDVKRHSLVIYIYGQTTRCITITYIFKACASGPPYGRKKRSAANETVIIDEVEISTAIEVTTDELAGEGDQQAISTDDVCLPNGGFYGLIAFFVIALLASVSASCFLFTRSRKSRKYMDDHHLYYKGTDGASNPSFR